MTENTKDVQWDTDVKKKFEAMVGKIPVFLREMAKEKVGKKAENNAREAKRMLVSEKDMVDAFFSETPFGFHGPMKCDMEEFNIDYVGCGYDR